MSKNQKSELNAHGSIRKFKKVTAGVIVGVSFLATGLGQQVKADEVQADLTAGTDEIVATAETPTLIVADEVVEPIGATNYAEPQAEPSEAHTESLANEGVVTGEAISVPVETSAFDQALENAEATGVEVVKETEAVEYDNLNQAQADKDNQTKELDKVTETQEEINDNRKQIEEEIKKAGATENKAKNPVVYDYSKDKSALTKATQDSAEQLGRTRILTEVQIQADTEIGQAVSEALANKVIVQGATKEGNKVTITQEKDFKTKADVIAHINAETTKLLASAETQAELVALVESTKRRLSENGFVVNETKVTKNLTNADKESVQSYLNYLTKQMTTAETTLNKLAEMSTKAKSSVDTMQAQVTKALENAELVAKSQGVDVKTGQVITITLKVDNNTDIDKAIADFEKTITETADEIALAILEAGSTQVEVDRLNNQAETVARTHNIVLTYNTQLDTTNTTNALNTAKGNLSRVETAVATKTKANADLDSKAQEVSKQGNLTIIKSGEVVTLAVGNVSAYVSSEIKAIDDLYKQAVAEENRYNQAIKDGENANQELDSKAHELADQQGNYTIVKGENVKVAPENITSHKQGEIQKMEQGLKQAQAEENRHNQAVADEKNANERMDSKAHELADPQANYTIVKGEPVTMTADKIPAHEQSETQKMEQGLAQAKAEESRHNAEVEKTERTNAGLQALVDEHEGKAENLNVVYDGSNPIKMKGSQQDKYLDDEKKDLERSVREAKAEEERYNQNIGLQNSTNANIKAEAQEVDQKAPILNGQDLLIVVESGEQIVSLAELPAFEREQIKELQDALEKVKLAKDNYDKAKEDFDKAVADRDEIIKANQLIEQRNQELETAVSNTNAILTELAKSNLVTISGTTKVNLTTVATIGEGIKTTAQNAIDQGNATAGANSNGSSKVSSLSEQLKNKASQQAGDSYSVSNTGTTFKLTAKDLESINSIDELLAKYPQLITVTKQAVAGVDNSNDPQHAENRRIFESKGLTYTGDWETDKATADKWNAENAGTRTETSGTKTTGLTGTTASRVQRVSGTPITLQPAVISGYNVIVQDNGIENTNALTLVAPKGTAITHKVTNTSNGDVTITVDNLVFQNIEVTGDVHTWVSGVDVTNNGGINLYIGGVGGGNTIPSNAEGLVITGDGTFNNNVAKNIKSARIKVETSNGVQYLTVNDIDNGQAITISGADVTDKGSNISVSGTTATGTTGNVTQSALGKIGSNGIEYDFGADSKINTTFTYTNPTNSNYNTALSNMVVGLFGPSSQHELKTEYTVDPITIVRVADSVDPVKGEIVVGSISFEEETIQGVTISLLEADPEPTTPIPTVPKEPETPTPVKVEYKLAKLDDQLKQFDVVVRAVAVDSELEHITVTYNPVDVDSELGSVTVNYNPIEVDTELGTFEYTYRPVNVTTAITPVQVEVVADTVEAVLDGKVNIENPQLVAEVHGANVIIDTHDIVIKTAVHPVEVVQAPTNEKAVKNIDGTDIDGKTVPKGDTIYWETYGETLKAGRPQFYEIFRTDHLAPTQVVYMDLIEEANKSGKVEITYDSEAHTIIQRVTADVLAEMNLDQTKPFVMPTVKLFASPVADGGEWNNTFTTTYKYADSVIIDKDGKITTEGSVNEYTTTSNKVTVYTPAEPKPVKDVVDEKGNSIDKTSVLENSLMRYSVTHNLSVYKDVVASREAIAKGFAVGGYASEGLDTSSLTTLSIFASDGTDVTDLYEMRNVLTKEAIDDSLTDLVINSGISSNVGEFYIWVVKDPQSFYTNYVKKGLDITVNYTMKIKEDFEGDTVTNGVFQVDFGNGYMGNVVENYIDRPEVAKTVHDKDGNDKHEKEVALGENVFYTLEGWIVPANRGYDVWEYRFVDVIQYSHDKFAGYSVRTKVDMTINGTEYKAGETILMKDLALISTQDYNERTGLFELNFNKDFLETLSRAVAFGFDVEIEVTRIAEGEVVNEFKLYVNGLEVKSNKVVTYTPKKEEPQKPVPATPVTPTPAPQENVGTTKTLPNTGETDNAVATIGLGLVALSLGALGIKHKKEDFS